MQENFIIKPNKIPKYVKNNGPIYLVDDDHEQHQIITKCYKLSKRTNPLVSFFDGQSFLQALSKAVETEEIPELVLLDINMPLMDGFSVLTEMKKNPKFQSIPVVIMLTASNREEDKKKAEALKANAYFSKPMGTKDYIEFFSKI